MGNIISPPSITTSSALQSTVAASYSVTTPPGCPPITLTRATVRAVTTSTSYVVARTTTVTSPYFDVTATQVTQTLDVLTSTTASRVTQQYYTTTTLIEDLPAPTTVTQPTRSGFTPVLCDPVFYNPTPTTTIYSTVRTTISVTSTVLRPTKIGTQTFTQTTTRYRTTITTFTDTPYTTTLNNIFTTTITRSSSISTIYAACATNNVAPNSPAGGYVQAVNRYYNRQINDYNSDQQLLPARDGVDCCALCQADSTCVASHWDLNIYNNLRCTLYKKRGTPGCSPFYLGATGYYNTSEPAYLLSNSGCGRWTFETQL